MSFKYTVLILIVQIHFNEINTQENNAEAFSGKVYQLDVAAFTSTRISALHEKPVYTYVFEMKDPSLWDEKVKIRAYLKNPITGSYNIKILDFPTNFCDFTLYPKILSPEKSLNWILCDRAVLILESPHFEPIVAGGYASVGSWVKIEVELHYKGKPAVLWTLYLSA